MALLVPVSAHAATLTVNTESDSVAGDGLCSLREAITAANADAPAGECAGGSGADVISLPAGFYSLTTAGADEDANATGDLDVTGDLTIQGAGAASTTIDGALQDRVLDVPTGVTVSLDGLTISGGRGVPGGAGPAGNPTGFLGGPGRGGGGILNAGTLTITDSTIEDNATGAGGNGGNGTAAVAGATGTGGDAGGGGRGGGVFNSGTLTLTRVTVADNATGAGGDGGAGTGGDGLDGASPSAGGAGVGGTPGQGGNGGGVENTGSLTVTSSTIAHNVAGQGGAEGAGIGGDGGSGGANGASGGTGFNDFGGTGGFGGGISGPGSVMLAATTMSDNHAGDGGHGGDSAGGRGGDGTSGATGATVQAGMGGLGGRGGAVSAASVTAMNVTMDSNAAGDGGPGGISTGGTGGNSSSGKGANGGAATGGPGGFGGSGGAFWTSASLTVTHATLSANALGRAGAGTRGSGGIPGHGPGGDGQTTNSSGGDGIPGLGGAVQVAGGTASTANSIVAGNGGPSCSGGAIDDGGHNLTTAGDNSCPGTAGDARLALLGDYGGPVETRALKPGSAGRDQVPAAGAGCPATDARGVARPQGGACDIGAYEVAPPTVVTGEATDIRPDVVTFNAAVSPNGRGTAYHFEYGLGVAYGSRTADGDAGKMTSAVNVSATAAGLLPSTTYHYRVVATNAEGTSAGTDRLFTTAPPGVAPPPPDTTRPVITSLSHKGTTFSYTLSEPARVVFTIQRTLKGRKRGKKCVKPTHANRKKKHCTLYKKAGSFTQAGHAGRNKKKRKLKPGTYRATLVATDPSGNRSKAKRITFKVARH